MLYFDLLPEDLLRLLLIQDKTLYKVSKSFLKLYMKMLEDLSTNDINPDMYFQLLHIENHKIPWMVVRTSDVLSFVVFNGEEKPMSGKCIGNMLIDINQSVSKVYYYYHRYDEYYRVHVFCYICKVNDSYMIIERFNYRDWGRMSIYVEKSWKLLVDIYKILEHKKLVKGNIFNYLFINNGYNINYIESSLNKFIDYLITFIELSF